MELPSPGPPPGKTRPSTPSRASCSGLQLALPHRQLRSLARPNAIQRFDPTAQTFHTLPLPSDPGNEGQTLGRPGELWAPESAADQLVAITALAEFGL